MKIILYSTNSPNNKLNKSLANAWEKQGTLRNETNLITPSILIQRDTNNFLNRNYCYIPEFGRYYYITDVESTRTKMWMIHLRVDVLMSFKQDILNSNAIITKQQVYQQGKSGNFTNTYLNDGTYKSAENTFTQEYEFTGGSDTIVQQKAYILTTL